MLWTSWELTCSFRSILSSDLELNSFESCLNYLSKNPQTTNALTFFAHIILAISGVAQYILQMHIRTASNYRSSETEKNFCRLYVCTAIPPTSYRFRTIAWQLREIVQWLSDFATWNLSPKLMQEQWYILHIHFSWKRTRVQTN